jgi:hypothetical protein
MMRTSLALALLVAGCSSAPAGSTLLQNLSASELAMLCDQEAANVGGYNNQDKVACSGGQMVIAQIPYLTQMDCVTQTQGYSSCTATFADVTACLATGYPANCTVPAACMAFDAPACQPPFTGGP